ncbi:hypothetical protein V5799_008112 [Amblyomma americanum]|uniref:Uncharacterized protein n=1 Tax=Amblyomma americanum TaxID=6943 RepID=A0AAQ4FFE2_AMBAM
MRTKRRPPGRYVTPGDRPGLRPPLPAGTPRGQNSNTSVEPRLQPRARRSRLGLRAAVGAKPGSFEVRIAASHVALLSLTSSRLPVNGSQLPLLQLLQTTPRLAASHRLVQGR